MNKKTIVDLLKDSDAQHAEAFAAYIVEQHQAKDKTTGKWKNYFLHSRTEQEMADLFKRVEAEGLVFDGKHITIQSTGISYDYIAYKNKMLLVYPESKIDLELVYKGDTFKFNKTNGTVDYSHIVADPFKKDEDDIVGGYCVIKNKRGEFITRLNSEEIAKHRAVAKTDYIWNKWFVEMCLKTIIKKACKYHFDDIFSEITEMDNENSSLENPVDLPIDHKAALDEINNLNDLKEYWEKHRGSGKEFDQYISIRKDQIIEEKAERERVDQKAKTLPTNISK